LSLEGPEFGERAVEEAIELRTGAVDGLLGGWIGGAFGFGLDFAAAAEAPESAADFRGEGFFDGAGGVEFGADGFIESNPDGLFVGEDEIARGEEAGFGGVFGGGRFALFGAGTGGVLGVGVVGDEFCGGSGHGVSFAGLRIRVVSRDFGGYFMGFIESRGNRGAISV